MEEGDEEVGEVAVAVPDLIKEVKHECRSIKFTISVSYMCTRKLRILVFLFSFSKTTCCVELL